MDWPKIAVSFVTTLFQNVRSIFLVFACGECLFVVVVLFFYAHRHKIRFEQRSYQKPSDIKKN